MEYMLDSANVAAIQECIEYFPVDGVTTNPTIISREKRDFLPLLREIRETIGPDRKLFVQTTANLAEDIVREAHFLRNMLGESFFLKIPVSPEGMKATTELKKRGISVATTALFTPQQALMAAKAGTDYVAPFVNRLDNILADGPRVVGEIAELFRLHGVKTKILAASFKNTEQIHKVSLMGSHAVTVSPELFRSLIEHPMTAIAIDTFDRDWEKIYGTRKIGEMLAEDHQ